MDKKITLESGDDSPSAKNDIDGVCDSDKPENKQGHEIALTSSFTESEARIAPALAQFEAGWSRYVGGLDRDLRPALAFHCDCPDED
jgi:hypothetical protein